MTVRKQAAEKTLDDVTLINWAKKHWVVLSAVAGFIFVAGSYYNKINVIEMEVAKIDRLVQSVADVKTSISVLNTKSDSQKETLDRIQNTLNLILAETRTRK